MFCGVRQGISEDVLVQITVHNRGPEPAELHVLPTLWFRNEWSRQKGESVRPTLQRAAAASGRGTVRAAHAGLGQRYLYCDRDVSLLFTENETNAQRIAGVPNPTPYVKDGINNHVVNGRHGAVNPDQIGTKVAAHYRITVAPGGSQVIRLRLSDVGPETLAQANGSKDSPFGDAFDGRGDLAGRRRRVHRSVIPASVGDYAQWHAGVGRDDVDQAVLSLTRPVAGGARSDPFKPSRKASLHTSGTTYNGDIICGQVGVLLVRGRDLPPLSWGSRSSIRISASNSSIPDAPGTLYAPESGNSRLTSEFRRRGTAGSCPPRSSPIGLTIDRRAR